MTIESTELRYLDGIEYVRVFFAESNYFEDVPSDILDDWKDALGHQEA